MRWFVCVLIAVTVSVLAQTSHEANADDNLIINGGFESGFDGWTAAPAPWDEEIDNTVYHSGSSSAKLFKQSWGSILDQTVSCSLAAGSEIDFSFWVNMPDPGDGYGKVFSAILRVNGQDVGTNQLFNPTQGWIEETLDYTSTGVVTSLGIQLDTGAGDGFGYEGPVWVDDVRLTATPEPSTFALLGVGAISLLGYAWRRRTVV